MWKQLFQPVPGDQRFGWKVYADQCVNFLFFYDGAGKLRDLIRSRSLRSCRIFGLTSREVEELWTRGYHAGDYYACHERLKRIVDRLNVGFGGESFADIAAYLTAGQHGIADPYMCLADFESYRKTHDRMISDYADQEAWSRRSLLNIASAGWFSADRSIRTYAEKIWGLQPVPEPSPEEG